MKEDLKDIAWLAVVALILFALSSDSIHPLFCYLLEKGMRLGAYIFILFSALCVIRAVVGYFKNRNKSKEEK